VPDKTPHLPFWDNEEAVAARPKWQKVASHIAFQNPWITIESHDVIAPTGRPAHYGLVRFANRAIGVLPLFDDGTVPLVGQARFALDSFSWEIPEGGAPYDEDPLDGAKRELREETGLVAANWTEIAQLELSNSVTDEVAVCYLATGLSEGEVEPDETEALTQMRVPFKTLLDAVIKGQVRDALTVVSVLRVHHMAVTGDLPRHLRDAILG
jgi:8-oxo-dGTP pyrophosphatase MutT (NUDIX family)